MRVCTAVHTAGWYVINKSKYMRSLHCCVWVLPPLLALLTPCMQLDRDRLSAKDGACNVVMRLVTSRRWSMQVVTRVVFYGDEAHVHMMSGGMRLDVDTKLHSEHKRYSRHTGQQRNGLLTLRKQLAAQPVHTALERVPWFGATLDTCHRPECMPGKAGAAAKHFPDVTGQEALQMARRRRAQHALAAHFPKKKRAVVL